MNIKQNLKKTSKNGAKKVTKPKKIESVLPKNVMKFQKEALFLGKIFGTIFLTLSIYTHHYTDPSFNRVSSGDVSNILGRFGSYSSDIFFQIFGISAYLIPLGIFLYFLKKNFIPTVKPLYFALQYTLVVSIISSFIGIYTEYNTLYCGFMGVLIAPFAVSLLNKVGTCLILSFIFLVGFITISNIPIVSLMYELYKFLSLKTVSYSMNLFLKAKEIFKTWREKRAELKEFKQDSKTISDVFDEEDLFANSSDKKNKDKSFIKTKTEKESADFSKNDFTFKANTDSNLESGFDVNSQKSDVFVVSKGFYRNLNDKEADFYDTKPSLKKNENTDEKQNEFINLDINKIEENIISDNKNIILDNKNIISDNKNIISDNENIISDNKNIISDNKNIISDNKNIISDNENIISDNKNIISDNENIISDNENIISEVVTDASHLVIETEPTPPAITFRNFELALAEIDTEEEEETINVIESIQELDNFNENDSSEIFNDKSQENKNSFVEEKIDNSEKNSDSKIVESISDNKPKLFQNVFDIIDDEDESVDENNQLEEINQKITIKVAEHKQNIFIDENRDANSNYELPKLEFLNYEEPKNSNIDEEFLNQNANIIIDCLYDFGVKGCVINEVFQGPTLTTYELQTTKGTRIVGVTKYSEEIASALKVRNVRMVPIHEKGVIGVEVPNKIRETVWLKEILASDEYKKQLKKSKLTVVLGKDISGKPVIANLAKMPHLLIAGTTGSGKSVFTNILITSILYNATADEVKFILIDPKMLEFSMYNEIPNLLFPVITDAKKASHALSWAVDEMERRYKLIADFGEKDILSYNERVEEIITDAQLETIQDKLSILSERRNLVFADNTITDQERVDILNDINIEIDNLKTDFEIPEKLPYIVIVLDEYADLMMVAAKEVEISIARIAQKARAAGIHLVIATQRPDKDVVTGIIKANLPVRVALSVKGSSNSRIIIDENGAEKLLGQGDMLYMAPGTSDLVRVQSPWVSTSEQKRVLDFLRLQGSPTYDLSILDKYDDSEDSTNTISDDDKDEKFEEALKIAIDNKAISASYLQRCLKLGYNRAARIIEIMEKEGIVGPANGSKARPIIRIPDKYIQNGKNSQK